LIQALKAYVKEVPLVLIALISAAFIGALVATILGVLSGEGIAFTLIYAAGFFIIGSFIIPGLALMLLYLPIALLFRNVRFRIFVMPCLSCGATMAGLYLCGVRPFESQSYFSLLAIVAIAIGLLTGLIHHFLMKGN